ITGYFNASLVGIDNPLNEFSDQAFKEFAPSRWMGDEAIKILEQHQTDGVLEDPTDLARAYLYAAVVYTVAADFFDDFALSDMKLAAPPIGEANMGTLYTTAIGYLDKAMAIVGGSGSDLERNVLAMRARVKHARGVWNLIGVRPISSGTGIISAGDAAAAAADAQAALAIDNSDWSYDLVYEAVGAFGDAQYAIATRLELRFGDDYIVSTQDDKKRDVTAPDRGIVLQDLIDNFGDPRLDEMMTAFEAEDELADLRLLSARGMYLILAEDALARGSTADFVTNINIVRGFSPTALTPYADGMPGITARDMLIHERRVNLYLQGRRLNDMYRFGIQSASWQGASPAASAPGTFFPITKAEIDANCHINPDWPTDVPCESPGGG
ncbi:MAG: hypothetical protein ACE5JM_15985, partial [Armatimonadota bacterium]